MGVEDWVQRFRRDDTVMLAIIKSMERSVERFPGVIDLTKVNLLLKGDRVIDLTGELGRLEQPVGE